MKYFYIDENDIKIEITPFDTKRGNYSTEEWISMVKGNPKYKRIINVVISIGNNTIHYTMHYYMNYNMKQADGISFIDHCYSKNEWDELNDTGMMSSLCVDSSSFDDFLVKIPYSLLVLETQKGNIRTIPGIGKKEYYWNNPINVFTTCVTNCLCKEDENTLTKKKEL